MFLKSLTLRGVVALLVAATLAGLFSTGAIAMPSPADLAMLGAIGATKLVHARVLVDFPLEGLQYKCDQVVKLPYDVAKALQANGIVDTHKDAVAYALSENGNKVLTHETEAERVAAAARAEAQSAVDELADRVATETDAAKKAELQTQLDEANKALVALG